MRPGRPHWRHGHQRVRDGAAGAAAPVRAAAGRATSRPRRARRARPRPARAARWCAHRRGRVAARGGGGSRARPARLRHAVAAGVRLARTTDNPQIAAIWNHEALSTAATTDTQPRSPAAQRAWLRAHAEAYPVVVAAEADEVL